jgi:hypothetical protein
MTSAPFQQPSNRDISLMSDGARTPSATVRKHV